MKNTQIETSQDNIKAEKKIKKTKKNKEKTSLTCMRSNTAKYILKSIDNSDNLNHSDLNHNSNTVDNSDYIEYKTSVAFKEDDCITPTKATKLYAFFRSDEAIKDNPTHRPPDKIVKNVNGSPVVIFTPGGSKLELTNKYGPLRTMSNKKNNSNVKLNCIKKLFDHSDDSCKNETENNEEYTKTQEIHITDKSLKATKFKNKNIHRSQNFVMDNITANEHTLKYCKEKIKENELENAKENKLPLQNDNLELNEDIDIEVTKQEWLHLIAFSIQGTSAQNQSNLVAGSAHANTEMMFIEARVKYLATQYPEGISLHVKAILIPKTHIAINIEYVIKTPDFTLNYVFDAQQQNQPHISDNYYNKKFFELLIECINEKKEQAKKLKEEEKSNQNNELISSPQKTLRQ